MVFYTWSAELEVGEETIDTQHKWLVDTFNTLMTNYRKGCAIDGLITALTYLYDYTENHFSYEEALQLRCGFPEYKKHKQMHDNFKETALNLVAKVKAEGPSDELAIILNATIGAWLMKHIKMEDSKIAQYIKRLRF